MMEHMELVKIMAVWLDNNLCYIDNNNDQKTSALEYWLNKSEYNTTYTMFTWQEKNYRPLTKHL